MSERDLHERASPVFLAVRAAAPAERAALLARLAPDDLRLQREVMSLLEHDVDDRSGPGGGLSEEAPVPGAIGPYRVVRRLGQGGGGYVLLGEQDSPVRRRVAIKLSPQAMMSPAAAARFEFERAALERAEHPNIARVLDAGRTGEGVPYLVMEYVEGEPITRYCRERRLGLRERVGLMLQVGDAVQHAHQRGVIHRDLKPANILVTEVNGRPLARVLDFGIAKEAGEPAAGATMTMGLALGTPAYMAPEQTGGRPVDTRADVYAIGAVLYELICGRPPVESAGDILETMRRVRETAPPAASRVGGAAPGPAALLADLDAICGRALEKDPSRRYATVAALGEDLARALAGEAISARAPTLGYRARVFARRHRVLVGAGVVVTLAVVLGISGLTAGLLEANRQRREAGVQGESQREINRFLTEDLLGAGTPGQEGENVRAIDLLKRASARVGSRFAGRPLIAAAVHHTLGAAFAELGAFGDAQRHLGAAVALRRERAGADAPDTVRSEIAAAGLLAAMENVGEAEPALLAAVERARRILGPDDPALYAALNDLGTVYETMDRGADAVRVVGEALEGRRRLLGERDGLVLITMSHLAQAYDRSGDTARALSLDLEALRLAESLPDPPRMTVIELCNNIGATYQDLNREREAEPYLRRAADLAESWIGAENPATLTLQANLAALESKLGDPAGARVILERVVATRTRLLGQDASDTLTARYAYWDTFRFEKRYGEAAAGYMGLLSDMERSLGEKHWLATQTRAMIGTILLADGRAEDALPYAERAEGEFRALYGPEHPRTKNTAVLLGNVRATLKGSGGPGQGGRDSGRK